jgi:hypothetical protein
MLYTIYQVKDGDIPIFTSKTTPKGIAIMKHRKTKGNNKFTFHVMEENVMEVMVNERILFHAEGTRARLINIPTNKSYLILGKLGGTMYYFKSYADAIKRSGFSIIRIKRAIKERMVLDGWTFELGDK